MQAKDFQVGLQKITSPGEPAYRNQKRIRCGCDGKEHGYLSPRGHFQFFECLIIIGTENADSGDQKRGQRQIQFIAPAAADDKQGHQKQIGGADQIGDDAEYKNFEDVMQIMPSLIGDFADIHTDHKNDTVDDEIAWDDDEPQRRHEQQNPDRKQGIIKSEFVVF